MGWYSFRLSSGHFWVIGNNERNGTVNLFVVIEPKGKKRYVFVTKHRKKKDFAKVVKKLVKKIYKRVKKLIFVLDNLNTHNKQTDAIPKVV